MRKRKVYGNCLFIQMIWMSLLDRSPGWETSNGAGEGVGEGLWLFNTPRTLPSELSRTTRSKSSFRCLVLRRSAECQLLSPFLSPPLPQRTGEVLFQMLDYINFSSGTSS